MKEYQLNTFLRIRYLSKKLAEGLIGIALPFPRKSKITLH